LFALVFRDQCSVPCSDPWNVHLTRIFSIKEVITLSCGGIESETKKKLMILFLQQELTNTKNFLMTYPSFAELRSYLQTHPRSTICDIRDYFHQQGTDILYSPSPEYTYVVWAYDIQQDFFHYLQIFIQTEERVIGEMDEQVSQHYHGEGKLLPFVLSMSH